MLSSDKSVWYHWTTITPRGLSEKDMYMTGVTLFITLPVWYDMFLEEQDAGLQIGRVKSTQEKEW